MVKKVDYTTDEGQKIIAIDGIAGEYISPVFSAFS